MSDVAPKPVVLEVVFLPHRGMREIAFTRMRKRPEKLVQHILGEPDQVFLLVEALESELIGEGYRQTIVPTRA